MREGLGVFGVPDLSALSFFLLFSLFIFITVNVSLFRTAPVEESRRSAEIENVERRSSP